MSVQVIAVWKHETDRRLWLRLSRVPNIGEHVSIMKGEPEMLPKQYVVVDIVHLPFKQDPDFNLGAQPDAYVILARPE